MGYLYRFYSHEAAAMRTLATSTVAARCCYCRISLELFAAGDVMTSPVITMTTRQSVYLLARVLVASSHSGFPVVQIDPHTGHESVYGLITRYIQAHSAFYPRRTGIEKYIVPFAVYRLIARYIHAHSAFYPHRTGFEKYIVPFAVYGLISMSTTSATKYRTDGGETIRGIYFILFKTSAAKGASH